MTDQHCVAYLMQELKRKWISAAHLHRDEKEVTNWCSHITEVPNMSVKAEFIPTDKHSTLTTQIPDNDF